MDKLAEKEQWLDAIYHLKKYESYKLKKTWGIVLIIIGIANFFSYILSLVMIYYHEKCFSDGSDPFSFMRTTTYGTITRGLVQLKLILVLVVPILLSLVAIIYLYLSVKHIEMAKNGITASRYACFGFAIIIMNCLSFIPTAIFYIKEIFIAQLWGGIIGCFSSYYLLTRVKDSIHFKETLYMGLILSFYAVPISVIFIFNINLLLGFSGFFSVIIHMSSLVFIIALIITGCIVVRNASKTL